MMSKRKRDGQNGAPEVVESDMGVKRAKQVHEAAPPTLGTPAQASQSSITNSKSTTKEVVEAKKSKIGSNWSISEPMGGFMLDIDPVITPDERYGSLIRL
jgi:hypothetical protein